MCCLQYILILFLISALFHFTRQKSISNGFDVPPDGPKDMTGGGAARQSAASERQRFTVPSTTIVMIYRKTEKRVEFSQRCNYLVYYCLHAYNTGKVCGRSIYYNYYTFQNYCLMDYLNCMERAKVWQIGYMGACQKTKIYQKHDHYYYDDDYFLDHIYVMDK